MRHGYPRQSYQALPSWLSRLPPEVPPTPPLAHRPSAERVIGRGFTARRLRLPVALLAVVVGVGAATAAGTVRARYEAESRVQMSAYATGKVAELRAIGALRTSSAAASPLAPGGSLTEDVPGYSDLVEGTAGRRFLRRWAVDVDPATGEKRLVVRVLPASHEAPGAPLDLTAVLAHR